MITINKLGLEQMMTLFNALDHKSNMADTYAVRRRCLFIKTRVMTRYCQLFRATRPDDARVLDALRGGTTLRVNPHDLY